MLANKIDADQKRDNGKTRKNRSKLLANMITKAKEKIRNNNSNSSNNQMTSGGSVTCLYDIRNKSCTSQSSKIKACVDSDSHFDGNIQSQPQLEAIDGVPSTSKDSSGFKLVKEILIPSNEPPLKQNFEQHAKVLDRTALIDISNSMRKFWIELL
ncbi:hypothetical protein QE152_g39181 [Popillia japonica]|uniref:Uncharacterized protein n=1 Tax=Popillia japonica TaxID=7064 RepID=A0AAW1HUR1_POPJA